MQLDNLYSEMAHELGAEERTKCCLRLNGDSETKFKAFVSSVSGSAALGLPSSSILTSHSEQSRHMAVPFSFWQIF